MRLSRRTGWDLRPNRLAAAVAARTRPFSDLTISNPTAVGIAYPQTEILAAWARPEALRYQPEARGAAAARAAVAAYYAARGDPVAAERLILTASTSEAYAHLFRLLCDPGDRVHVPRPSYPLLDHLAALGDVELAHYPLWYDQGWHLDLAQLERELDARSRALVVIHPNNPTGSYCHHEESRALAEIAVRHGLALIVDEVFFDYPWERGRLARPAGPLVFTLNGLSKMCGLPQAKLAWIAVGGQDDDAVRAANQRLEIIADTFLSVGGAVAAGAADLLALRPVIGPQIAARVAENLAALDAAVADNPLVTRLAAEGGWNAVLRWPAVRTDEEWAELLLERADVLVHPGHFYDFAEEAMLVVSLLPPPAEFAAGLARCLPLARTF